MRLRFALLAAVSLVLVAPSDGSGPEFRGPVIDHDLPGSDSAAFDVSDRLTRESTAIEGELALNGSVAHVCRDRCARDSRCKAWTREHTGSRPREGAGGRRLVWIGRCPLKDGVPDPVRRRQWGDWISAVGPGPPLAPRSLPAPRRAR